MRKFLLMGAGLAMLAGTGIAVAQAPGQPPPPPGAEGQPPGPGGPEGWMRRMHEHGHEHGMHEHGGAPWMHMMMQASKAARFHFSRGENVVDIRCAADEPTKACVDAASALLDKLASQAN